MKLAHLSRFAKNERKREKKTSMKFPEVKNNENKRKNELTFLFVQKRSFGPFLKKSKRRR